MISNVEFNPLAQTNERKKVEAGIADFFIYKGLTAADYRESWPDLWKNATVNDLGKAATGWPQAKFII